MVESFSEDEEVENKSVVENTPSEIRELLTRKLELEKRQRSQELHRQRVKVSVLLLFYAICLHCINKNDVEFGSFTPTCTCVVKINC